MRGGRIIGLTAGLAGMAIAATFTAGCDYFGFGNTPAPTPTPTQTDASLDEAGPPPVDGGPVVTSVPAAWQLPADCHGVGNLCPMNCTPGGECQTGLDVCIPMAGPNGFPGPSAQTPYCMASTCMTFDQASCFCKGPAGSQFPECAAGPAAVVGLCGLERTTCSKRSCCGTLKCVKDSPTSGTCYKSCATSADCPQRCCTDLKGTGELECAPLSACQSPCKAQGGSCTDSRQCCTGTCVTPSPNPDFAGCRPSCTTNADCLSGCCKMFSNSTGGFCIDGRYCSCAPPDTDCTYIGCCAGSSCGSFQPDGGGGFRCYKDCTSSVDCDGGCCSTNYPGKTYGGCAPSCR